MVHTISPIAFNLQPVLSLLLEADDQEVYDDIAGEGIIDQ